MFLKEKIFPKPKVIIVVVRKDGKTEVHEAENLITTPGDKNYRQPSPNVNPHIIETIGKVDEDEI